MFDHLIRATTLDWTIVRASKLVNTPPGGYHNAIKNPSTVALPPTADDRANALNLLPTDR